MQSGFERKPGKTRHDRFPIGLDSFGSSFGRGAVGFAGLPHYQPPADARSAARIGSE